MISKKLAFALIFFSVIPVAIALDAIIPLEVEIQANNIILIPINSTGPYYYQQYGVATLKVINNAVWSKPAPSVFACVYDGNYDSFPAILSPRLQENIPPRSILEANVTISLSSYKSPQPISKYEKLILIAAKEETSYYGQRENICAAPEEYKNKLYAIETIDLQKEGQLQSAPPSDEIVVTKEGIVNTPFAINAWGYSGWGPCTDQDGGRASADAYCKSEGYNGTQSGDACYHGQESYRWRPKAGSSYAKLESTGGGLAFTKVKCAK